MRFWLILLVSSGLTKEEESREDAPSKLFDDYWQWKVNTFPEDATSYGIHSNDDQLNSHSFESHAKYRVAYQKFLDRNFQQIASTTNETDQLNLNILEWELAMLISSEDFKEYQFVINNIQGSQTQFENIIQSQKLDNEEDYRQYLSRLKALPQQVYEDIELLKSGLKEQRTLHNLSMFDVPREISLLLVEPENTIYYEPFKDHRMIKTISNKTVEKMKEEAKKLIKEEIQVAYKKLNDFITEDYSQSLRPDISISSIPGGKEYYTYLLKKFTSTVMSAEEIHGLGMQEVTRIDQEIQKIIEELGFNETLRDFAEKLQNDSRFIFNNSESILEMSYHNIFGIINPVLPKVFWKLPKLKLEIKPTSGSRASYIPGSVSDQRPGVFLITVDHFQDVPVYELLSICLHEGLPGHHLQEAYFQEKQNVPEFRKSESELWTVYMEGWALYAEYLGLELGLYKDPYDRFGYYSRQNFRAAALVVDTGIHEFGWTKQQAVDFLMEHTSAASLEIEGEVNRYITKPGQATASKVGELKIRELRKKAETELDSKFDIRDFHGAILDCGVVPLNVLETCIEKYIEKKK